MYFSRKVLSGKYKRKEINGVCYIVGDERDIKPQQMEFSDNHRSELIDDFISIDVENGEEILCFTNKYGPIYCMGLKALKEIANSLGRDLPDDIDEVYPIQVTFSFPEYQFKYFHKLVINIWELQNDIAKREHDAKLFWDFLHLLFQPYGWCDLDTKYLGIQSDMPLAMFAEFYHEMTKQYFIEIKEESVDLFTDVVCFCKSDEVHLLRKSNDGRYTEIEIPDEYKKCLYDKDFMAVICILEKIRGRGIFDSLERSYEEFKDEVDLNDMDDDIFGIIRNLGKILICDIVNDYITSIRLHIDEEGNFVKNSGDSWLISMIFDELTVLCQYYETRRCEARNKTKRCDKYFIVKKRGREKKYCCKKCADRHIKYLKRNPE